MDRRNWLKAAGGGLAALCAAPFAWLAGRRAQAESTGPKCHVLTTSWRRYFEMISNNNPLCGAVNTDRALFNAAPGTLLCISVCGERDTEDGTVDMTFLERPAGWNHAFDRADSGRWRRLSLYRAIPFAPLLAVPRRA